MGDDRMVPLAWVRAVVDGTDPVTAEAALNDDAERMEDWPQEAFEAGEVEDAARRYRAGNADARRDALLESDARLAMLAGLVEQRDRLDRNIRSLVCLLREWEDRPPSLADLAAVTGMSTSGVRSCYTDEDRDYVQMVIGSRPRGSRDPERLPLRLPNPFRPNVFLGVDVAGEPVTVPADASVLVDIPLDDLRRGAVQKLLTLQLADRILVGSPTPTAEAVVAGFDALMQCVVPQPQWQYAPGSPEVVKRVPAKSRLGFSGEVVSAENLPRLRLVATMGGDLRITDDVVPQWLIGHVRPAVAANAGRVYLLEPPDRAFQWKWKLTGPDGGTTDVHLASAASVSIEFPGVEEEPGDGDDTSTEVRQIMGALVALVRARIVD